MRRAISMLITIAILFSFIPATPVFAEESVPTMSGVRIEYPTCTTNRNGQGKNTSTTFTDSTALPDGMKYENSYNRVEWLSHTADELIWFRGAIAIKSNKDEGKYGAYKIRVPAE
ncbi:MAG: hypothetical protein IJF32_01820, partial [Oscillospiraceae bacterium]|nr:hypothetical protein [Oscillospiraceae bacterium]